MNHDVDDGVWGGGGGTEKGIGSTHPDPYISLQSPPGGHDGEKPRTTRNHRRVSSSRHPDTPVGSAHPFRSGQDAETIFIKNISNIIKPLKNKK